MPAIPFAAGLGSTFVTNAWALTDNTNSEPGKAILISASVAGTVTLTLPTGDTVIVNVVVGDNIYPFAVRKAVTGTATVAAYYNLA